MSADVNVDVAAPPFKRKTTLQDLIAQVEDGLKVLSSPRASDNVKAFILHVGWYESLELTRRRQLCGGPGRSFFQFEPARAKESIAYAKVKGWLDKLAGSSERTAAEIEAAGNALPSFGSTWPEDNPVEILLASDNHDLFATYLIRIALRKVLQAIPMGNDSHAVYWADRWKIVFASAEERQEKIAQFKAYADAVDQLNPPTPPVSAGT
jgi:hypothetical protein